MPAKKNKKNKPNPTPTGPPKKNLWDFLIFATGRLAHLTDKNLTGGIVFGLVCLLLLVTWRWPAADLPNVRESLMQPLIWAPWGGLILLGIAFRIQRSWYKQRIAELTAPRRVEEQNTIPGRITSGRYLASPASGESTATVPDGKTAQ